MPRQFDLTLADPEADPRGALDPLPRTPVDGRLERHPHVRRLRREIARLREALAETAILRSEMVNRGLTGARNLEPLNPAPPGIYPPEGGLPTFIHVDNLRLLANRVNHTAHPTVRFLLGGPHGVPRHCYWLRIGDSELVTSPVALPNRSSAFVVLQTLGPVTVLR